MSLDSSKYFDATSGNLSVDGYSVAALGLTVTAKAIHENAKAKGWWENSNRNFGEALALIHSEVSEALEAWRDGDDMTDIHMQYPESIELQNVDGETLAIFPNEVDTEASRPAPKPVGVASELADVVIRIFDLAIGFNIPIVDAILEKHNYNQTRPFRHGNKKA